MSAVVTGAARGIGLAVARALAAEGHAVAAVDLQETADDTVTSYVADVSDAARVEEVVAAAERELGPVTLLVNVAGILRPGPVVDCDAGDWEDTFAVNTRGVFLTSRAVARLMRSRRTGSIVTVSSNAAGIPRSGMAAYAASKAAATMFTKCLGLELAEYGIRCNVVAPGSTDTDMQRPFAAKAVAGDPASFRTGIPLGRIATPQDIADAVLFLASDRARHITMHDLYVDGGATLRA